MPRKERRDIKQPEWRTVVTRDLLLRSWTKNPTTSCLPTARACEERESKRGFMSNECKELFQWNMCPWTHHLNRRLPIIARCVQICSGKAPDLQALQVTNGSQADIKDMTVAFTDRSSVSWKLTLLTQSKGERERANLCEETCPELGQHTKTTDH